MATVRLFDFIEFDGRAWQVVAQDGTELALRDLGTNRIRKVPVLDLLQDDSLLPDEGSQESRFEDLSVLDTVPTQTADRALFVHRQVYEVLHGYPPQWARLNDDEQTEEEINGIEPNLDYDPSNTLESRIEAKVEELRKAGTPLGKRSLKGYIARYRDEGIAGLVDKRTTQQTSPTGTMDPRVVALLEQIIERQGTISTGSKSRIIGQLRLEAAALELPLTMADSTIYRIISQIDRASLHTFGNATTRRTQGNKPDRSYGAQKPIRPGELVEIDSTPFDVLMVMPDKTVSRPTLVAMIDVSTRTVCGARLHPGPTKGVDLATSVLARSLTPLPMVPGWDSSMSLSRSILPAGMIEPDEELRSSLAARPIIFPTSITIDRGKDYLSKVFMDACEYLQIDVVRANPRTPTDKPHIERTFAAINSGFSQFLNGYVGRNVVTRGASPDQEAVITLQQAQDLLDGWLVKVWQNRPHDGLRHPAAPGKTLTPNEMYRALSGVAPTVPRTLTRDDYISLLPRRWNRVQPYGIKVANLRYSAEELRAYVGRDSGLKGVANGRWEVHYDPWAMGSVYVRDHHEGRWIEAVWQPGQNMLAPFSMEVLQAAIKAATSRDPHATSMDYLAEINRIQTSSGPVTRAEKKASRSQRPSMVPVAEPDLDVEGLTEDPEPTPPSPILKPARKSMPLLD